MALPTIIGRSFGGNDGQLSTTVTPGSTIATGNWIVIVVTGTGTVGSPFVTFTAPAGFTEIPNQATPAGTLNTRVYVKIKADGETSYTFSHSGGNATVWGIIWGSGSAPTSDWVLGTVTNRAQSGTSFTNIAPAITTTKANTLVLAISGERTSAAETDAQVTVTGATKDSFSGHQAGIIQTVAFATKSQTTVGTTGTTTFTYPNTQATNGQSVHLGIPEAAEAVPAPTATVQLASVSNTVANRLRAGWFTTNTTNVRMVVSTSVNMTSPVYSSVVTPAASGAVTAVVSGLTEGTQYYIGLEVDGTLHANGRASARTLKASRTATSFKIVAGSCNTTGSNTAVFDSMRNENAEFFVHMGDRHYADTNVETTWRAAMKSSMLAAKQQQLVSTTPLEWTPDNHDWGGNRSYSASPVSTFAPQAVRELMGDFEHSSAFYKSWVHGNVRFVHLDRWSLRDKDTTGTSTDGDASAPKANDDPTKVMLGTVQETWFKNILSTASEDFIVVFTGFPVSPTRFAPYGAETTRIADHIASLSSNQRDKIVTVGGDSHDIRADSGASKSVWGVPTLNVSPLDQTGSAFDLTGWDIGIVSPVEAGKGYYSRLTFQPGQLATTMIWEAVRDDGAVLLSWSKSRPTVAHPLGNVWSGKTRSKAIYVGSTKVWPK